MSELTLGQFALLLAFAFLIGAIPLYLGYRQTQKQREEVTDGGD